MLKCCLKTIFGYSFLEITWLTAGEGVSKMSATPVLNSRCIIIRNISLKSD